MAASLNISITETMVNSYSTDLSSKYEELQKLNLTLKPIVEKIEKIFQETTQQCKDLLDLIKQPTSPVNHLKTNALNDKIKEALGILDMYKQHATRTSTPISPGLWISL